MLTNPDMSNHQYVLCKWTYYCIISAFSQNMKKIYQHPQILLRATPVLIGNSQYTHTSYSKNHTSKKSFDKLNEVKRLKYNN